MGAAMSLVCFFLGGAATTSNGDATFEKYNWLKLKRKEKDKIAPVEAMTHTLTAEYQVNTAVALTERYIFADANSRHWHRMRNFLSPPEAECRWNSHRFSLWIPHQSVFHSETPEFLPYLWCPETTVAINRNDTQFLFEFECTTCDKTCGSLTHNLTLFTSFSFAANILVKFSINLDLSISICKILTFIYGTKFPNSSKTVWNNLRFWLFHQFGFHVQPRK